MRVYLASVCVAAAALAPAVAQDATIPITIERAQNTPAALDGYRETVDPVRLDLAVQILDRGLPPERRVAVFMSTTDGILEQMDNTMPSGIDDPEVAAIVKDHRSEMIVRMKDVLVKHLPSIMEGWAIALAMEFTEKELRDILAFVSTPSGQRFFENSSKIVSSPAFAAANEAYMRDIFGMIPQEQRKLRAKLREHLERKKQLET